MYDDDYARHVRHDPRGAGAATIPNLHLVGRNGMHKYNNQDHAMMTAMLCGAEHHRRRARSTTCGRSTRTPSTTRPAPPVRTPSSAPACARSRGGWREHREDRPWARGRGRGFGAGLAGRRLAPLGCPDSLLGPRGRVPAAAGGMRVGRSTGPSSPVTRRPAPDNNYDVLKLVEFEDLLHRRQLFGAASDFESAGLSCARATLARWRSPGRRPARVARRFPRAGSRGGASRWPCCRCRLACYLAARLHFGPSRRVVRRGC